MESRFAVSTRGLGRRFGRFWALAHVDLDARPGEVLLLAGPNGAGKTTLLRILACLMVPTAGELRIFGLDPHQHRLECRREVCFVSHHAYLYDRLSAIETVRIWTRLLGRTTSDAEIASLLDEVDLAGRGHTPVGQYSAGMRKRLTLLRTRLEQPRIVLLDEPFAALDPAGQALIEDWIEDFRRRGLTVIMASHAVARAAALCSRALLLQDGQLAWHGPAAELPVRLLDPDPKEATA